MAFKLKKFLKAFARSKDYKFALEFAGASNGAEVQSFIWNGFPYFYRPRTSDAFVAYECMLHGTRNAYYSEYLPSPQSVKTIVDIGSNVGASVMFWKKNYPSAQIYCFEPIPSNFEILKRNCAAMKGVTPYNEALGEESGEITFIHSPGAANEGGWSVFQRGVTGSEQKISIPILKSGSRLSELGVDQIDILKVDTEGAEKMIIKGLGNDLLKRTAYICGELHGEGDFELLNYLEMDGFLIGARKSPKSVLFNFEAIRRA